MLSASCQLTLSGPWLVSRRHAPCAPALGLNRSSWLCHFCVDLMMAALGEGPATWVQKQAIFYSFHANYAASMQRLWMGCAMVLPAAAWIVDLNANSTETNGKTTRKYVTNLRPELLQHWTHHFIVKYGTNQSFKIQYLPLAKTHWKKFGRLSSQSVWREC